MSSEALVVRRGEFRVDDPWETPAGCESARLRRATDGAAPRLETAVAAFYDDQQLTVVFSGADDHLVASYGRHDDPLYEEDVVEVFLAPARPEEYFEIEVNPLGTTFDARLESPDGVRATMRTEIDWTCEGLMAAVRRSHEADGTMAAETVIRIPFAALGRKTPEPGEEWRGNFFRIDRHPSAGDEFTAWQPTMKTPADFHVTAAFGVLRFE